MKRKIPARRDLLLLLWLPALGVLLAARASRHFAEAVFAGKLYRVWRGFLRLLTGWLPFSLAEWLLYAFVLAVITALVLWALHIIKGKGRRGGIAARGLLDILLLLGILLFLFILGCGGNYYRATYGELSGLRVESATVEDLRGLYASLAERANGLREELSECEDESGVFALPYSMADLGEHARTAMEKLGQEEEALAGPYPKPKPVLWSRGMSRFGITGVFFPFTAEANVNIDTAEYSIGAAMCHELSHFAGFMREDEANYLAYRACTRSGDLILDYSGTVLALIYTGNALYRVDPAAYREIRLTYCGGLRRDLAAEAAYWDAFEDSVTEEMGERMNDAYLKANQQSSGIESYGEMVDLLLAEYLALQNGTE